MKPLDTPAIQNQKPLDQVTKEEDVVRKLRAMIGEAEEAASYEIRMANKNYRYLRGEHFQIQGPKGDWITDQSNPYWRLRLKRDIIGPVQSTTLPILHKLRPKVMVEADFPGEQTVAYHNKMHIPLGIDNATVAGQVQRVMEAEWERRGEEILSRNPYRCSGCWHRIQDLHPDCGSARSDEDLSEIARPPRISGRPKRFRPCDFRRLQIRHYHADDGRSRH